MTFVDDFQSYSAVESFAGKAGQNLYENEFIVVLPCNYLLCAI